jgi:hypothetical protein
MSGEHILSLRSRSGKNRFCCPRKRSANHHGPSRAAADPSRFGKGRARDHHRYGSIGHLVGRSVLAMMKAGPVIIAVIIGVAWSPLSAKEYRSREVTREFQREHPCPSTGKTSAACPDYRKDHIVTLACGGPDAVSNLQSQTVAAAKSKDHWEHWACSR